MQARCHAYASNFVQSEATEIRAQFKAAGNQNEDTYKEIMLNVMQGADQLERTCRLNGEDFFAGKPLKQLPPDVLG